MRSLRTLAVVAALVSACGNPLENPPPDLVANAYVDVWQGDGYAALNLWAGACLELPSDTEFRFQGEDPIWETLGGRYDNNPLSAYIAIGCEAPTGEWQVTPPLDDTLRFEVTSGDVTRALELSSDGEVTGCDFPTCEGQVFIDGER